MKKRVWFLLCLGLSQMVGDVINVRALRGLGAATNAAPAPMVFCSRKGLETFSSEFTVHYTDGDGNRCSTALTPETRMAGPYNRRNIYGAVIAYGPYMPVELRDPVLDYAVGEDGVLLKELGITDARDVTVKVHPKFAPADMNRELQAGNP